MSEPTHIQIRNAREHNLKGVDLDVPRHQLVVFTGVSGSGKSSLVYDTLHKEGQRRFMESLSAYARQFLGQMERPKVDLVHGISPTVCIDQKTVNRNPRSTVGTITEISDHLRLLYARLGTPHCPECGEVVARLALDQVVARIMTQAPGERALVLAPVVRERKGEYRQQLEGLHADGWSRVRVDGELVDLATPPTLARYEKHTIEVVVDRLKVGDDRARLAEAVEVAARLAGGIIVIVFPDRDANAELSFATERACPNHPEVSVPELEPRLFSFNAPQGACPTCNGLGALEDFDVDKLVDLGAKLPLAFNAWNDDLRVPFTWFDHAAVMQVAKKLGAPFNKPLEAWPPDLLDKLLYGDPDLVYVQEVDRGADRTDVRERAWRGLVGLVQNVWHFTHYDGFAGFRTRAPCHDCGGKRLHAVARSVTFRDRAITDLSALSVADAFAFFAGVSLATEEQDIGATVLQELHERLSFLVEVGLDYLTLDRSAATLSGGEAQRIRLAAQVGSAMEGVTYVLDEPSIGLHPRDNRRLLGALRRLRDRGNSVLVVEHDAETMLAADWLVDVGPAAGVHGGRIVASGTPAQVIAGQGATAAYLRGERAIAIPPRREPAGWLTVRGARVNNLRDLTVRVPLGVLVVVTGASGSGKSSLVFEVLDPSVRAVLELSSRAEHGAAPVGCDAIDGVERIDKLIEINQQPIGRTPRSNPATYVGVFDTIRDLFAQTAEARARGYKKGRFSFNVAGGRCESCQGAGVLVVELQFLPSVEVPCDACAGRRFNRETLEITWRGLSIADVLDLTIDAAAEVFGAIPKVARVLNTMVEVGLGYVTLGQPSTTLSGGEAQRVKLATELARVSTGKTLYLLDEPTTGLHFEDVERLLTSLQALVNQGNSVLVVEHNVDVMKSADYLIDLGPEGGTGGGQLIGEGPPEHVATLATPTGQVLAELSELVTPAGVAESGPSYAVSSGRAIQVHTGEIVLEGVRTHNLKDITARIPHGKLTVITGVSGSGKTSLAFDTLFAEGQRRYVESLSTYARRFLGRMERAPMSAVSGLQPAIAVDQKNGGHNPRSTVATVTEIHDVLRILYARVGEAHCPQCDVLVRGQSASDAARLLSSRDGGAGWLVAPLAPARDATARRQGLIQAGWARLLVLGSSAPAQIELDDATAAEAALVAGAYLVVDRFNPVNEPLARLAEAVDKAYVVGDGLARFVARSGEVVVLTQRATCPTHGVVHSGELTPRHFSFNGRLGACTACDGLGTRRTLQTSAVFVAPKLGLWDALEPRVASALQRSARKIALAEALIATFGKRPADPVASWPSSLRDAFLDGHDEDLAVRWSKRWGGSKFSTAETNRWEGLASLLDGKARLMGGLFAESVCKVCQGGRLRPELLAVRFAGLSLAALCAITVDDAASRLASVSLVGADALIAERPLDEVRRRLSFLADVGLGYLALDRAANTLSGGESQRIRLASQLGAQLVGVTYVLDEPTIGLHPRDTDRLLATLEGLRDLGNTVVLVEHDLDTIRRADHVIDIGPAAGQSGGEVCGSGTPTEVAQMPGSVTGRWLAGVERLPSPGKPRKPRGAIVVSGAREHNLRDVTVKLPTGIWLGVAGVSGSGKSSLIMDTVAPALQRALGADVAAPRCDGVSVEGPEVKRVVLVDQSPIGRSPRSSPATYTKTFDPIRALFAETLGAKTRGWAPGRFSFNSPGGRCELCEGRGATLVEMHFLPDVWVVCDACGGKRFSQETLSVRWRDKSIADVLAMRVDDAAELFANHRSIARRLNALVDVGLGYLSLGQPATTLSGGEAQRVKLASELYSRADHTVFILDEPTTGLHMADVEKLVTVLHRLVDQGHTVITIEHHLGMLAQADFVIELGPDGGEAGGQIVFSGRRAELLRAATATGIVMRAAGDD